MGSGAEDPTGKGDAWKPEIRAGSESAKPKELTHDLKDLDAGQRNTRLEVLRNMLASSEARYANAMRNRRPDMTVGQRLAVVSGHLRGRQGFVLDADFIHNRVQLDVADLSEPQWVPFNHVRSV